MSAVAAPAPLIKFQAAMVAFGASRGTGLIILLTVLIAVISVMLLGTFLDHLTAMGSSRAPRGATPNLNFAFPVSEFGLSLRLKINSLFSVLMPPQGGGLYDGGRI